jgi:hypothetical protein
MYNFYATLLDTFHWYQQNEKETALEEFLSSVNRTSKFSEAAARGTAFNELIDAAIKDTVQFEHAIKNKQEQITFKNFTFPTAIVKEFVAFFSGSVSNIFVEAPIETQSGTVRLYGYIDEIKRDWVYDIKTKNQYKFPAFMEKYQHLVYPYCLHEKGTPINNFQYTITDFNDTFVEEYIYNHERDSATLRKACSDLIEFIERPEIKSQITNLKIYGLENN